MADGELREGVVLTAPTGKSISGELIGPAGHKFGPRSVWLKAWREGETAARGVDMRGENIQAAGRHHAGDPAV